MRSNLLIGLAFVAASSMALPALAQDRSPIASIDFGNDSGAWPRDGECDDPRFIGPGSADLTVVIDVLKDATDCRALYAEEQIWLLAEAPDEITHPKPTLPEARVIDNIDFGDDSSSWANDGECDDRRFFGPGMATLLTYDHVGKDATDCAALYLSGEVRLWNANQARSATQCSAIDFGDDSGPYSRNQVCDDARFEGVGAHPIMDMFDIGDDASDCRAACDAGRVFLRDY